MASGHGLKADKEGSRGGIIITITTMQRNMGVGEWVRNGGSIGADMYGIQETHGGYYRLSSPISIHRHYKTVTKA